MTIIETYSGLHAYLAAFRDGKINLLVLVGGCGVGKSRMVREVLGDDAGLIEASATAFGLYHSLFEYRDQPIVIDDVDGIYRDPKAVSLLKLICRTDETKLIKWNARSSFLEGENLPPEFTTKSRVLIISNEWKTLNRNVAALEDRGHVIRFAPSPQEIHKQAASWFRDEEIYQWFGDRLHKLDTHSFRAYYRAAELKAGGIEWRKVPGGKKRSRRETLALEIFNDPSFESNQERAATFERRGGGCRSTFFNYRRKFEAESKPAELETVSLPRKPVGRPRKEASSH